METVVRVAFVYLFVLALLRMLGKRELSQLTPFELVLLLLIPELVSQALIREDFSMTNAVVAVTTLTSLVFLTSALAYRFPRVGSLVQGKPALIVDRGAPVLEVMDRERISVDEIAEEMRQVGIERLDQVRWAVLEPGGKIAVIAYRPGEAHPPPREEQVR